MDVDEQETPAKHVLISDDGDTFNRPAKRSHVAETVQADPADNVITASGSRAPAFGPSAVRTASYQEAAAVPPELRSRLESIGMRTRFNVNRGYGSPPPSQLMAMMQGQGESSLMTANDVLRSVRNTRNTWSRTKSAPLHALELQPFGGASVRPELLNSHVLMEEGDENAAPLQSFAGDEHEGNIDAGIGLGDLKRGHDAFLEDWASDASDGGAANATTSKPTRALPSTIRFSPRRNGPVMSSMTMPVNSGLGNYLAQAHPSGASAATTSADEPWRQHDFTTFATGNADF